MKINYTYMMRYSVIIPVYNRPDEVDELLQSLTAQHFKDFEVVVVEDGSSVPCEKIVNQYQGKLDIHYYNKPNSGPGQTRNYGAERSNGEYLIILDSDCILPEGYLDAVEKELQTAPADAFGGPDRAHSSFTDIQKAINYSMTSFFTTGGIRGGKKKMDKFYPRSFNMGVRREVYQAVGTEDFLIEENRMMKKYLEKEGVKVTYHEAEGIHDWSFWNKYLPEAVEWLLK